MSVSNIGKPDKFSAAFNPVWFYFTSDRFNNEGYKYILDIFPAGSTTRIARETVWPRPGDSIGQFSIGQILKNKVGLHLNQTAHTITTAPETYYKYDVYAGEEYVHYWSFPITFKGPNDGTHDLVSLSGNLESHKFQSGDEVIVKYTNPNAIDGVWTLYSVTSNSVTLAGSNFAQTNYSSTSAGTVVISSKRKTQFTGLTSLCAYTVYDMALSNVEMMNYTSSTYNMKIVTAATSTIKWLTNVPNGYNVRENNSMWLNFYSTTMVNGYLIELTSNNLTVYYPQSITSGLVGCAAVGPHDFIHSPFSASVYDYNHTIQSASSRFDCNTTEYSVRLVIDLTSNSIDSGGTITWGSPVFSAVSESKTFRYNTSELGQFTNQEIYFMDRKGSMVCCNFELMSIRNGTFTNSQFKTLYGDYVAGKQAWGFNSTDSSTNTINTIVTEQLTVYTNWMTVDESNYFAELLTTNKAYIREYGMLWPVVVKTTNIDLPTKANKKNINKVLLIEYANNNAVQY